ncbi:MAG: hypothetical protein ACRDFB_02910 [Rhabdochlamydiaceae bacterium]
MLHEIRGWISTAMTWTDRSIKEIPIAGNGYILFNENITNPSYKYGCLVKNYAASHFKGLLPKAHQHPIVATTILSIILMSMAYVVGRAFYAHYHQKDTSPSV